MRVASPGPLLLRALLVVGALLLLPLLPLPASAHEEHYHSGETGGEVFTPEAAPLTPEARYVDQRNVRSHRGMVVWQERALGRDWDVYAYNLSTDGPAFPVTIEVVDQTHPVVRGPWIAWQEKVGPSWDIVALNVRSGQQFRMPDTGGDDVSPVLTDRGVFWMVEKSSGTGSLRGWDLVAQRMLYPAANSTIVGPPSAYRGHVAWAEGDNVQAKMRVWNEHTGKRWDVPELWSLVDGPAIGPWGVAFIADVTDGQRGTYTMLYENVTGTFTPMRNGVYPHARLAHCDAGVLWDQGKISSADGGMAVVAMYDGFTKKYVTFGSYNRKGTCTGDTLLYEKDVPNEDEDLPRVGQIYALSLRTARPPAKARILLDDGLERGIFRDDVTFTGIVIPGDPREPLEGLWYSVDGEPPLPGEAAPVKGGHRWRATVELDDYFNGEHKLTVIAIDSMGVETRRGFVFFVDGVYQTDRSLFDQPLNVPREEASGFPWSIIDHYQRFRAFYNTVILILGLIAVVVWQVWKYVKTRPRGKPEFVRGEDGAEPVLDQPRKRTFAPMRRPER